MYFAEEISTVEDLLQILRN